MLGVVFMVNSPVAWLETDCGWLGLIELCWKQITQIDILLPSFHLSYSLGAPIPNPLVALRGIGDEGNKDNNDIGTMESFTRTTEVVMSFDLEKKPTTCTITMLAIQWCQHLQMICMQNLLPP